MNIMSQCKPLALGSNQSQSWKIWKTKFYELLSDANLMSEPDIHKNALILHFIGNPMFKILMSLNIDYTEISHTELIEKLDHYFMPVINVTKQRIALLSRKQEINENLNSFLLAL